MTELTLPTNHHNGGLAVIAALAAHGVDTIFGIPGTHNLEFYRHLPHFGIRAITPRHEQGAGYAADAYYLVSGKPGVVITTSGPGLTNVVTAAATAYAESRAMLILSPGVPTGLEGADAGMLHETKDSSGALARLLLRSHRARTAEGATQSVAEAFATFASQRPGPIHIEVPLDVLEGPWAATPVIPLSTHRPDPAPALVARAAEVLATSKRPLIIAGGGACKASGAITQLAHTVDAPVVTTCNGKGVLDENNPLSLGSSIRFDAIHQESQVADALLVIGSELADSDLWEGSIGQAKTVTKAQAGGQTVIRVDIDPDQLNKNLVGDVLIHADAELFTTALLDTLATNGNKANDAPLSTSTHLNGAERAQQIRQQLMTEPALNSIGAQVTRAVMSAGGPDTVIAGDSSQVTYDGTVHAMCATAVNQLLYMPGFATLGYSIPAAIGAKIADRKRPVAAILGDGAAMFSIQEIATATELKLTIPFVIVDNGGYAEIEQQMRDRIITPFAVRFDRPDFALLGQAMGAHGVLIDNTHTSSGSGTFENLSTEALQHLQESLTAAFTAGGPTVIHLRL